MIVDVSDVLLDGAHHRLRYAQEMLAEDLHEVADPDERAYYLRNRCVRATEALSGALELVRIYWTKVRT